MTVFIDTSAFLAVLNANDDANSKAQPAWETLLLSGERLITSSYVIVETVALLQRRLGIEAVQAFHEVIEPILTIEWVDAATHQASMSALLAAQRRRLSLVDCASFVVMRQLGIQRAFAVDKHFKEQGFVCLP